MPVNDTDYLLVLKGMLELPFPCGKTLLIDYLRGDESNDSITRNNLNTLDSFGSLAYEQHELAAMVEMLARKGLIQQTPLQHNRFIKVLQVTEKGRSEVREPTLHSKKRLYRTAFARTCITEKERLAFAALGQFLHGYNDEQKKAIISNAKSILCIAGPGSGKTTVLTKRIEYLTTFRSVPPNAILAITFTRKAREEMMHRLANVPSTIGANVQTFNSFCEGMLREHGSRIYGKACRVVTFKEKRKLLLNAIARNHLSMEKAVNLYFTAAQMRGKTAEELGNSFLADCFYVLDYFKTTGQDFSSFEAADPTAQLLQRICSHMNAAMKDMGLRDYTDQLLDTLALFDSHPDTIPAFSHVLIDEYQDINATQDALMRRLSPESLFVVGDPRQSIFGWRGSSVEYILSFPERHRDAEVITLSQNYRSTEHIVAACNQLIKDMRLPDIAASLHGKKDISLKRFSTTDEEFNAALSAIRKSSLPLHEIFVLARTNRLLRDFSDLLKARGIAHILKTDDEANGAAPLQDEIVLATVHSIKGMEAECVLLIGCSAINFPCRASDHPAVELFRMNDYDKEEEELRLLYVALSRAKSKLWVSYTGSLSPFVTSAIASLMGKEEALRQPVPSTKDIYAAKHPLERLKAWRLNLARQYNVAAFMILTDRTLHELIAKQPMSLAELQDVSGFGPAKIKRYGNDVLKVLQGM